MSRTLRRSKSSYLAEFIIIIAGVTVSFLVNEWRENKKTETKKQHLLVDINNDLHADSLVLESMGQLYQIMANAHDTLLSSRKRQLNPDSLTQYLEHFTSYHPFTETANTYKRINADNELTIERSDSLIWYYLNLHNLVYPRMHEWLFVEKEFVMNTALPYMNRNAPFIYSSPTNRSFDGVVFYELRKKDEFMNYLKSGRVYKQGMLKVTKASLNYVKFIKAKVTAQIKETREEE